MIECEWFWLGNEFFFDDFAKGGNFIVSLKKKNKNYEKNFNNFLSNLKQNALYWA